MSGKCQGVGVTVTKEIDTIVALVELTASGDNMVGVGLGCAAPSFISMFSWHFSAFCQVQSIESQVPQPRQITCPHLHKNSGTTTVYNEVGEIDTKQIIDQRMI